MLNLQTSYFEFLANEDLPDGESVLQIGDSADPALFDVNGAGVVSVGNELGIVAGGSPTDVGIFFENEEDTGLYHPAVDTLAIATGGVERLRVDAAGNLGIGTVAPLQMLFSN